MVFLAQLCVQYLVSDHLALIWGGAMYSSSKKNRKRVRVMVFNAIFNNISFISWQSVLLVEETRVPGENH